MEKQNRTIGEIKFSPPTLAQRIAEKVTGLVGSWKFITIQSIVLLVWVVWNVVGILNFRWDPYPFILMNLFLSLQAAYTAPLILIAGEKQSEKDRKILYGDYCLDKQSNSLIQGIHSHLEMQDDKIDLLLKNVGVELTDEIKEQEEELSKLPPLR